MTFPAGFAFGVATASYQVEGAVDEDGRRPSIWDTFSHTPGKTFNGDNGDVACDHYHRYADDVELLASLGISHYRFSLAWPRIQPDGSGPLNPAGLDFYSRLVDSLLSHGIEPWVTLYHWDLPQALEDAGGWPARDTAHRFADYAAATYARLGDRIGNWTTLNEPWCSAFLGYHTGRHAPGRQDPAGSVRAVHHLLLGHGLAISRMRALNPGNQLGITVNLWPVSPVTDSPSDVDAARRVDGISNRFFLDPILLGRYPEDVVADLASVTDMGHVLDGDERAIAAPIDVLGVNYYTCQQVRANPGGNGEWVGSPDVEAVPKGLPTTEMGWEVEPDGLRRLLLRINQDYPRIPLYVTENGIALPDAVDAHGRIDDPRRIEFIDGHLRAAAAAVAEGVDLRGYFVWTFTDNFEWSFGYSRRFGLYYLDYPTQRRIPKSSAAWYAKVARTGELPEAQARRAGEAGVSPG
jgi:beta-glucosidase